MKTDKGNVKVDYIRKSTGFLGLFFFMLQTVLVYGTTTLNVSPGGELDSLSAARDKVRELRQAGTNDDIIVEFESGTYVETNTVVFGLDDSAPTNARTIYRAATNADVVISGGQSISNWVKLSSPYPDHLPEAATGNVWVASVPWATNNYHLTSLCKNGEYLTRAISESGEMTVDADAEEIEQHRAFYYNGLIRDWPNISDIAIRKGSISCPLASVNESNQTARLALVGPSVLSGSFRVENAIDYLDEPGEWVLNSQDEVLYYWPQSGDPTTEEITAFCLQELVRVEGTNDQDTILEEGESQDVAQDVPVRGLVFEGLTFAHVSLYQFQSGDILLPNSWGLYDKASGLLRFRGAEDCVVSGCTFKDSGCNGVRLDLYCQNITVENSLFQNIGYNELVLCGYGPGLKNVNHSNTIVNNTFLDCKQLINNAGAIFIFQSADNLIAHNSINTGGVGVDLSGFRVAQKLKQVRPLMHAGTFGRATWQFIREDEIAYSNTLNWANFGHYNHTRNNRIRYNEIRNTGDNCVYISGCGPNLLQYNALYRSGSSMVRFDMDSYYSTVAQNVIIGTGSRTDGLTYKYENDFEHNLFIRAQIARIIETSNDSNISKNIFYHAVNGRYYELGKQLPDYNILYDLDLSVAQDFLDHLQDQGKARHSTVADPKFVNYDCANFSFQPDSPALDPDLNINEIAPADFDQIGLRSDPFHEHLFSNKSFFLHDTPGGDSDGDGLRDEWEVYYFGDLTPEPTADPDGDGANNLAELTAETNPTRDPADYADDKDNDGVDDYWEVLNYGSTWAYTPPPTNEPPRFRGLIHGGKAYNSCTYSNTLVGTAIDPDDDPLTFSMVSGSNWLSVATNGMLSGTPPVCLVEETNYFSVRVDSTGGSDQTLLAIIVAEGIAPEAPTLNPPAVFDGKLTLSWSEPESNLTYSVYRSETSNSYGTALALNLTSAAYVDTNVVDGTIYYYIVTATDEARNESDASNEVSGTPVNQAPFWENDPIVETAAAKGVAYSSSLANDAADPGFDPLTFSKIDGPTWLSVASDGTLSGTPPNIGINRWTVRVSDGSAAVNAELNITVYSNIWTDLLFDDFEAGWGNWKDGGGRASLSTNTAYVIGGQGVDLEDNNGNASSTWLQNSLDLSGYTDLKIEFTYMTVDFNNGEGFWLRFSDDGGTTWTTIKEFLLGTDFSNGDRKDPVIIIDSSNYAFTTNVNIRFECDASGTADDVYIDNVRISSARDGFTIWAINKGLTGDDFLPGADPDGDNLNNLGEWYIGSDPKTADSSGSILTGINMTAMNSFEYTHDRPVDRSNVLETYQWSTDLNRWNDSGETANGTTVTITPNADNPDLNPDPDYESVTVQAAISGTVPDSLFSRLVISKP